MHRIKNVFIIFDAQHTFNSKVCYIIVVSSASLDNSGDKEYSNTGAGNAPDGAGKLGQLS